MYGSSLPPVVCRMSYLRYLCLFGLSLPSVVCRRDHVLFTLFVFVWFVFTFSCLQEGSSLIYVICVCLRIVVFNAYCVAFFFFLFVLCTLGYIIYIQVTDIKLRYLKHIFNNIVISKYLPYKSSQDMSFLQQRKMDNIWLWIVNDL